MIKSILAAVALIASASFAHAASGNGQGNPVFSSLQVDGALTYGGVTLSNSVTGTGSMVLSASPTLTGTLTATTGLFSGTLEISGTAATFVLSKVSGNPDQILSQTAGVLRWAEFLGNSTAESGSNVGSDFQLCRAADAGTLIDCPMTITRSTGLTAFTNGVGISVTGPETVTGALTYGGVTLANSVTGTGSMVLSASPTFTGTLTTASITATLPAPVWASYTTQFMPATFNVGSLPITSMVGGFTPGGYTSGGMTVSVMAALDTPSTDQALLQPGSASGNINIALAGNCRTASTVKGCVGVYGGGMANADGTAGDWGANFVATNYPYLSGTSAGFNAFLTVGVEIDLYLNPPATGVLTGKAVELLMYTALGSGATLPTGGLYGIEIGTGSNTIGLVCALCIDGGPNSQAISIGQAGVGDGFNSQVIALNAVNSGGTVLRTTMYSDQSGNIDFAPYANAGIVVVGAGNSSVAIDKSASGSNNALYGQTGGLLRWIEYLGNGTAEGGSNVGSDWQLCRGNDAGTLVDCPFTITRSSGAVALGNVNGLSLGGTTIVAGGILSSTAAGGIGYATGAGAGGSVTQPTSKATGVTLNKATGAITMSSAALAAGTTVSFTLTDTSIAATDVLALNQSGGTPGSYSVNAVCAAGSATIYVRNNSSSSLSEAIVIVFDLLKGSITMVDPTNDNMEPSHMAA